MIAVKGYLQLLERDGPQASPERMNTVLARVDDLSRLVDEFFELSVLDSDDHELTIERVDATALVSQTLLGHRAHLSVRGVAPRVSLPPRSVMVSSAFSRPVSAVLPTAFCADASGTISLPGSSAR